MHRKGINYDVGTLTVSKDSSSRELFDPLIVQREIEIIKNDLHCTAIRISGQDITRLFLASECALRQGLEVWFSPRWIDATEQEMLAYLAQCAEAAEQLHQQFPQMVFVVGCELTFFLQGLVDGNTALERMQTFLKPWRLLKSTLGKGPFNKRLNAFLAQAGAYVKQTASTTLLVSVVQWRHEQDPSAESLTRTLTRTGDLPGTLCSAVAPTHQPREHGALPHRTAERSAPQNL